MLIIPAIDILDGQCVRLRQGRFEESTVFSDDPAAMAKEWIAQGAAFLHVVDLDGARRGLPQNLEWVRRIAGLGKPVQLGGGLRTIEDIRAALAAGATRIVVGSRVATDPQFAAEVIQAFGEKIAVGIDAKEGMVAIRGWQEIIPRRAPDLAKGMEQLGAARIIFTDIARDGTLTGPNYTSLAEIVAAVKIPIIASGGITTLADLRRLRTTGVEACIIGRALYTGDVKLAEAIRIAEENQTP